MKSDCRYLLPESFIFLRCFLLFIYERRKNLNNLSSTFLNCILGVILRLKKENRRSFHRGFKSPRRDIRNLTSYPAPSY